MKGMKMNKDKTYAVVTTISTHRMRYVVPMDDLQELNTDAPVSIDWANDCVVCGDVEEFSQIHLGEQIVDTVEMTQEELLKLFDRDNDYLKSWSDDKKIDWISKWRWSKE